MGKFRALLVISLRSMLCTLKLGGGKRRTRAASGVGALVFMAVLAVYLSGVYSFVFAQQLSEAGMLSLLLLIMPVMAVAMGFIFTLFAAQGILFGGRDNDLMLSMPISAFSLLLCRTLALYLENLVCTVFVLLPAGVAYAVYGGGGPLFFPALLLAALFLALLPTLLSLLCGYALSWLSGKFARTSVLSSLLYFVFFGVMMVLVMRMNGMMTQLAQYAGGMRRAFGGWGLPFLLLERGLGQGDLFAFLAFCAFCPLPLLAALWLFAPRYKAVLSRLSARGARSDYQLVRLTAAGQHKALLQKEARRYFGTPIYLFNTGFGLILLLGGPVAAVFFRGRLLDMLDTLAQAGLSMPLVPLLTGAVCLLLSTVSITASSISLEGKQLWILKEAPVSPHALFAAKYGFHLLLCLPCAAVACLLPGLVLGLSPADLLLAFALSGLFAGFCALFGLYVNLCLPRLDAPNDMSVVKNSAAAMVSTFGTMLLAMGEGALFALLLSPLGLYPALLAAALPHTAGLLVCLALLRRRGPRLLAEL